MQIPWNKGLKTGPQSEETRRKKSESAKKRGGSPWNKGKPSWRKGKTADKCPISAQIAEKQRGQKRTGNFWGTKHWKGEGNPWFGKSRSSELSPRYNPERHKREFLNFENKVAWLTEVSYEKYQKIINPLNLSRCLSGSTGGFQLDHKIPIMEGFKLGLRPEIIAHYKNLQMLPWLENVRKSSKISDDDLIPLLAAVLSDVEFV